MSIPNRKLSGILLRIGSRTGSQTLSRNCTIGLEGSGFTQLIKARTTTTQHNILNKISRTEADADIKLDRINIMPYPAG
jgi:hypothetical protein